MAGSDDNWRCPKCGGTDFEFTPRGEDLVRCSDCTFLFYTWGLDATR
jgi:rubredoxin